MAKAIGRDEALRLEIEPWDLLAQQRASDIDSGADVSFHSVLARSIEIILAAETAKGSALLDIGCGTGRLLPYLTRQPRAVHAIDPSLRSVELARTFAFDQQIRCSFDVATVQLFAGSHAHAFDVAVANMVLMDVVDLEDFMSHARQTLKRGALFIATLTHPFFWPSYWKYDREPWFDYRDETFVRSQFRTSLTQSSVDTLHVHRPLAQYATAFTKNHFAIEGLLEPVLPERVQRETGVHWSTPHFLIVTARAI